MPDKNCKNCDGTGWTSYEVPGVEIGGVIHMRERISPCHACNAQNWNDWAQQTVDYGRLTKPETK